MGTIRLANIVTVVVVLLIAAWFAAHDELLAGITVAVVTALMLAVHWLVLVFAFAVVGGGAVAVWSNLRGSTGSSMVDCDRVFPLTATIRARARDRAVAAREE